jgi:anti-sigma factor RsiW
MTQAAPTDRPADVDLVAFLDGELAAGRAEWLASWLARDGELRQRLTLLEPGRGTLHEAFAGLLAEAPEAKLEAMLLRLPGYRADTIIMRERRSVRAIRSWPRIALLAAGIVLFFAGAAVDRFAARLREAVRIEVASDSEDEWREAVAEYMSLYTPETLSGIPDDATPKERELAAVGAKLGIGLRLAEVSLPGLALKRAQLLQYDGNSLGQVAYLDPRDGVVALCIYTDSHKDSTPSTEQRAGLNIVHWASHGRAFMLVGHKPMPELRELASALSQRLTL